MPDAADSTPYSKTLDDLWDAEGEVETYINGVDASPAQEKLLAFLEGPLKDAITAARNDPSPA
jgi:hypothetical protein